jgi:integrase
MGKTTSAIIKLVLRTNKTLSNGLHPIMLRVQYYGRKELSTGCACNESDWDSVHECIKNKKYPNQAQINKIISDMKQNVVNLKLDFEITKTPYTAQKLLIEGIEKKIHGYTLDIYVFINKHMAGLSVYNTKKTYGLLLSLLEKFSGKKSLLFTEVTPNFCEDFGKYMKNDRKMSDGSILTVFAKLSAIFNYAIDKEIIQPQLFPFRKYKYFNVYKKGKRKLAITNKQMYAIHGYYGELINCGGNVVDLEKRHTATHAMAVYLFGWLSNGLALVDIAKIKVDMIKNVTINNKVYYKIQTVRAKTNVEVDILIEKDIYAESIIPHMLKNANLRDGYLFPILQNNKHEYKYLTEKQKSLAIETAGHAINKQLKKIVIEVNKRIVEYNQEINNKIDKYNKRFEKESGFEKTEHEDCGELLPSDLTFYSMRHSFATSAIKNGVLPSTLATMMGRSQTGIFGYVNSLMSDDEMAAAKTNLYD